MCMCMCVYVCADALKVQGRNMDLEGELDRVRRERAFVLSQPPTSLPSLASLASPLPSLSSPLPSLPSLSSPPSAGVHSPHSLPSASPLSAAAPQLSAGPSHAYGGALL